MLLLIVACGIAMLVYGLIAGMLGTIIPDFSRRFQLSARQMGQMGSAQALGLIVASFAAGPVIEMTGKRAALLGALVVAAFGLWRLRRATNFVQVVAALFLIDCGGGVIVDATNAFTFEMGAGVSEMTKANLLNAAYCVGGLLTSFIAANFCGRDARRVLGVLLAVAALALFVNLANPVAGHAEPAAMSAGGAVASATFWLVSLLFFFGVAAEVGVWNWLVPHLIARGVEEGRALNILSLGFGAGLLVGRVAIIPFVSLSPVVVTAVAAALMIVTTAGIVRVSNPSTAWAVVFAAGLATSPIFPNCVAITMSAFPNNPTALGWALVSGWSGMAVVSPAIAAVAGRASRLERGLLVLPAASALLLLTALVLR